MNMIEQKPLPPCRYCKSTDIVIDFKNGDIICTSCGIVQTDRLMDVGSEDIIYEDDDDKMTRSSGLKDDNMNIGQTSFVVTSNTNGQNETKRALERAMRENADRKEKMIIRNIILINECTSRMNLSRQIKVMLPYSLL